MRRLLRDPRITKIFCDGTSGADRRSLGIEASDNHADLEDITAYLMGATGVQRGLARILNLAWPQKAVRVTKDQRDKKSVFFLRRHRAREEAAAQGAGRDSRPH